ncbi:C-C chemokine receptor-like 2 isoform X1 [Trichechus manatus latirostris]|uniref:C-C chemokine receptor-like 2 isoform X1 n=2 Tax=Trichechus manatus latirostris TaxID=127582 RepID=A0A2Y9D6M1_TRIMA|nr:C-C chemokine receptor-like 2 isoform X1 [Trichechus manatus latirostris]
MLESTQWHLATTMDSLRMDNYTAAPDYEYDVLIEGDLKYDDLEQCDKYDGRALSPQLAPMLCSVFVVCLLGNLLVVLILVKYKGLRQVENVYFLNLAFSNLLFSLTLPFRASAALSGRIRGDPMHTILIGIYTIGLYSEVCFNVLLTVHRFLLQSSSSKACIVFRSILTSVLAWTMSVLISLPECVIYRPQMEGLEDKYSFYILHLLPANKTFWKYVLTLKMNVLGLLFPLFIFIFCYVQMRDRLTFRNSKNGLYKLVFTIMAIFLLMWAPYNIAIFLSSFKERFSLDDCKSSYGLDQGVQITEIIAATHCLVNPPLHVLFDQSFRRHLSHVLHLSKNTPVQPGKESGQDALRENHEYSTGV